MNLTAVDLNLFVVLDAVLAERSATRAAARLHVTQSAVSNALARLRRTLGDPLVVRTRRGLAPTPRALALQPRIAAALAELEAVAGEAAVFELRTASREFTIAAADHYGPLLLPPLVARMRAEAPGCRLRVVGVEQIVQGDALATGEVDVHVGVPGVLPAAWRSERLFDDDHACVLRRDHPAGRRRLTLDAFCALSHVQGRITPTRGREVDDALARLGRTRAIVLTVPHLSTAIATVAATDLATVVSRGFATYHARHLPLRVLDLPLPLPRVWVSMQWHHRADADPAVRALRGMIREVLAR